MLTNPLIFRSLINHLREHEVLETSIIHLLNPLEFFSLKLKYRNKLKMDNQRWLAYEISNILNSDL
jgi:hypothetical protein